MSVMVSGVGRLLTRQVRYRRAVFYRLAHNSQVCKMRALLNDMLDGDLRRVEIADAVPGTELLWVRERAQEKPVELSGYVIAPPRGYDTARELNFVVRVPVAWRGDEPKEKRLVALINGNKLVSMRYRIEYNK